MKATSKSLSMLGIFAVVLLLGIPCSYYSWQWYQNAMIQSLFDGPYQLCKSEEPAYYNRVQYNTSRYQAVKGHSEQEGSAFSRESAPEEIAWVDGEDREEIQQAMSAHAAKANVNLALEKLRYDSVYKERCPYQALTILYPENHSLYPPNLCAPFVQWEDGTNTLWQVCVEVPGRETPYTFLSKKKRWRFPASLWEEIQRDCIEQDIGLTVKGIRLDEQGNKTGAIHGTEPVIFRISKDPVDDYIVYRLVAPPFSSFKTPDIFSRDLRQDDAVPFLSARRRYCLNCHTFSSKQGNTGKLAFQVRSLVKVENNLPTYLAIYDMDKKEGFKVRLPFEIQMTTFTAWSPDGNQLAYSANQKIAALKPIVFETQLAGMSTSDIAIYDLEKEDTYLVPGACDPNLLEIYPQWTPDGKRLVFTRSPVGQHPAHILFDMCVVDLEVEGKPEVQMIGGASQNGRSNFFPRFSPDGKWFSFCQSDGGDLIRASSDLCIMAGDLTGPSHPLSCNVDYAADSWHSWSSNSKWIVFASKREGGVYAYLYLTHIDDEGKASPAIPMPLVDQPLASYNIPEFVAELPDIAEKDLFDAIRVEPTPLEIRRRETSQGLHHDQEEKNS